MSFVNILIGTGVVWLLTAFAVVPLANWMVAQRLRQPAYAHVNLENLETLDEGTRTDIESMASNSLLLADVLVMAAAGIVAGIFGYWFIGISLEAKWWPGIIALSVLSIVLSSTLHS